MSAVIVVAPDDLEALLERTVRRVLEERGSAEPIAEWLDTKGAAELLGVHPRTVNRLVKAGTLPATKVGKLARIKRADVIAYLEREGD